MKEAFVLYGATDLGAPLFSADILWATGGFRAPDPFFLIVIEGKSILVASPLEVERAQKEAHVDEVALFSVSRGEPHGQPLARFLKERGVTDVIIPETLPYGIGTLLSGFFSVRTEKSIFQDRRSRKSEKEIEYISGSQEAVELALEKALFVLRQAEIRGDSLYHPLYGGSPLTSEDIRGIIDREMFANGYLGIGSIVACGAQAADPHCQGSGSLRPFTPIVIDIFPRSLSNLYYADQTRTVFKGEPNEAYKKMYVAVLRAQTEAIAVIRPGIDGFEVYKGACQTLEQAGYTAQIKERPVYGFIHGLGHGVGIDIHEYPSLGSQTALLEEGMVVTVEPGLYYSHQQGDIPVGGIRIEDMVVVTKDGCKNLTQFPKRLEDVIL